MLKVGEFRPNRVARVIRALRVTPVILLVVTLVRWENGPDRPTQAISLCYFAPSRRCAGCVGRATFEVAENGASKYAP
jgi:hypothetical protein